MQIPKISRKNQQLIVLLILFVIISIFSNIQEPKPTSNQAAPVVESTASNNLQNQNTYKVIRVVDGDTIELEGKIKLRYIGIDTPEVVKPDTPVECFGKEASAKNKELVEGKYVTLEKDVSETDRYGRLLRYVYIDGLFVNEYMVKEGYAHASSYPPDVKYQNVLRQAEREARENNRGFWGSCSIDTL